MSRSVLHEKILELMPALTQFSRALCRQNPDAEDLVQETILKALSNQERYVENGQLKSWLFTIMKNTFCTRFKKLQRETVYCDELAPTCAASQDKAMELQDVGRAFASLSPCYKETVECVIFDGMPYDDAAKILNCSVGTVKSRLHRARAHLALSNDATPG
ncbi:RNA polymerase sigma factor [Brucella pseudogrignonensis]|uniref:RNA polymerase sigma factor n=1 Tax=Brucella pseudogrignonensis TaxID=419475 RepID=A0A256GCI5_9HYPH|nr:RNA polymerase sigma factor [Brucella pseudogrignonensis]OYR24854.1 RNA polymerase sigma factor, sigma-70 family protein [Brucella pseudogrignonensis]